jgi:hypothetical protein
MIRDTEGEHMVLSYCIIEFRERLFETLLQFGIIALWRRRIRSVSVMELPQGKLGEDCLCTNSVISFSTECPDLGNWRLHQIEGPERTTMLVVRLYRICREQRALPPSLAV